MKVLFLTSPFCGGENIALSIAKELDYKVIIDPIKPRPTEMMYPVDIYSEYPPLKYGYWDRKPWPTEIEFIGTSWHSPFNMQDIPDNTISKHIVGWEEKFPAANEEEWLDNYRAKFDKTICIGTDHIEFVAKWYMAVKNSEPECEGIYFWEYWRDREEWPYKEEYWNNADFVKVRDAVNKLKAYAETNSLLYIKKEDIYQNSDLDKFNDIVTSMDIGLNLHDKTVDHKSIFHAETVCQGELGFKY